MSFKNPDKLKKKKPAKPFAKQPKTDAKKADGKKPPRK
jgi:hypothetical protein